MIVLFNELKTKDVINLKTGSKLGRIGDCEIDIERNCIKSFIVFGRQKFLGIFGQCEEFIISWCDIEKIGQDTILVCVDDNIFCKNTKQRGFFSKIFN